MIWRYLHRKGIARILNSSSMEGRAFVEARGPQPIARELAFTAVRHSPVCRADWQSLTATQPRQVGYWHWTFQIRYSRAT